MAFQAKDATSTVIYFDTASGAGSSGNPYVPKHAVVGNSPSTVDVTITAGTLSSAFALPNAINAAIVGLASAGTPTITIQVSNDGGTTWIDTIVTAVASTTAQVIIYPDKMSQTLSAFAGQGSILRLKSSATVTIAVRFFSRTGL
jgi:Neuraminidase (sialidase)